MLLLTLASPFALATPAEEQARSVELLLGEPQPVLIDVRSAGEFADGGLPGARHIPHEEIAAGVAALNLDKDTPIVLYCRSGRRSGLAQQRLRELGYRQVLNAGGYEQLRDRLAEAQAGSEAN